MADNMFKLQLLARAELAVKDVQARRLLARSSYLGFALVLFLLALGMLNLAGFLAFEEVLSPAGAALAMAAINAVGVALLMHLSKRAGPSEREEALAREIREMAYQQVNHDVEEVKEKLEHVASEVTRMGENVHRATGAVRFLLSALGKNE
ncbi:hypothetical protein A3709_02030 [Halioglobus sp. HI00S01]|nr:hypothetical protein A3709_02030 [Halioglobus sp. HI00S01]